MSIEAIQRLAAPTEANASGQASATRPAARITSKPGPLVQFEAFVLQNFIQSILPQDAKEVFGEGTAGEVWKSMMAEKIALQVAEAGGIGIAKMIAPKGNLTPAPDAPGAAAANLKSSAADQLLEMQATASQGSALANTTGLNALKTVTTVRGSDGK